MANPTAELVCPKCNWLGKKSFVPLWFNVEWYDKQDGCIQIHLFHRTFVVFHRPGELITLILKIKAVFK